MALAATLSVVPAAHATGFLDTFDSIDPAWTTDRYEPAGFTSANFDGDNRLKIDISAAESAMNRPSGQQGAFYNTQGRQRASAVGTQWEVAGDVYISTDMLSGENLRRTDLWTRDNNPDENSAAYAIFGVIRNDASDAFNPSASGITTRYRIWDADTANGWVDLGAAVTGGWHHLSILSTGTAFEYRLDGGLVYTDSTYSASGFEDLRTTFVQAYNFGDSQFTAQNYSVYWDNISAQPVPEPATMAALGFGALALLRRRKKG
ncbi:MAG: hypothetical protein BGO01_01965 [Armatimonadetes bacterium 55-13]|nr:MAG: hypothetical protein BGO01_01965 [Armatimonadetes bacterium 55-13]